MTAMQTSTLARARNFLMLGLMLWTVSAARADTITNRIYPSDPTLWTLYQGATKYPSAVAIAPDGSVTTPIQAGTVMSGVIAPNPVPVGAGELDTFSVYYRYMLGAHPNAHLCINGVLLGQTTDQCLTFNAVAGTYFANDIGILDYSISPVGPDGWLRVSIVFKTSVGGVAAPYVAGNNGQLFAVWGAQFITGPYSGRLIPTIAASASGVNQEIPNDDNLSLWGSAFEGKDIVSPIPGRGSSSDYQCWSIVTGTPGYIQTSNVIPPQTDPYTLYIYSYIKKNSGWAALRFDTENNANNTISFLWVDSANGGVSAYKIPYGETTEIIDFAYGISDAGSDWLVWIKSILTITVADTPAVSIQLSATGTGDFLISACRTGIQVGGVFP